MTFKERFYKIRETVEYLFLDYGFLAEWIGLLKALEENNYLKAEILLLDNYFMLYKKHKWKGRYIPTDILSFYEKIHEGNKINHL